MCLMEPWTQSGHEGGEGGGKARSLRVPKSILSRVPPFFFCPIYCVLLRKGSNYLKNFFSHES